MLILLFADSKGELRVILTMRSASLSSYSGHAALPGGKSEEGETAFDTARRESSEEIGLPRRAAALPKPFRVEHLCEMPTNLAKTELVVRPCVAFMHSYDEETGEDASVAEKLIPRLDAQEVAAVFSAPFKNFLSDKDLPDEEDLPGKPRDWYKGMWTDWHESRWRMHNFFVSSLYFTALSLPSSNLVPQHVIACSSRPRDPHFVPSAVLFSTDSFQVPVTNQTVTKPKKNQDQKDTADHLEALERYRVFGMTARILVDAARFAYAQEPSFEHNSHFGDEDMIRRLRKIGRLGDIRKPTDELTKDDLKKAANL